MEELIRNNWILQAYFTENYSEHYPKEIVQFIITLQLHLYQPDCNQHHNFFSLHNEIYFHTATEKSDIHAAKLLLVNPENKHDDWKSNCLDWQSDLRKIYEDKIIILVDIDNKYHNCERSLPIQAQLTKLPEICWSFYEKYIFTVNFPKKYLDQKLLISTECIIIVSECKNNLLYPLVMHFPTFHFHIKST